MLVGSWVHWDSTHYLAIASTGYEFQGKEWPNIAFFPLYPLLIRAAAPFVGGDVALAGVLVAQLAFFAALLLLYDLLAHDFGAAVAYRSLVLLLVVPTSFFFVAAYSESLALLLLVAAVWALRRKRWWLAGAAGLLLALTRLPGVLIAPILVVAYLHDRGWNWRAIRAPIAAALLPPLGLALFMLFQWWRFDTPFAFLIAQQKWKNHLSLPWVLPRTLIDQIFIYQNWPMALFQSLFWVGFVALTIAALVRLPPLYSLTLVLFLLPPFLSSWPWSISRHVLLGFPAFIILARWTERPLARRVLFLGLLALLALATVLFVNAFLVA
jgi:Gpi18-like mannosyltransferase